MPSTPIEKVAPIAGIHVSDCSSWIAGLLTSNWTASTTADRKAATLVPSAMRRDVRSSSPMKPINAAPSRGSSNVSMAQDGSARRLVRSVSATTAQTTCATMTATTTIAPATMEPT